MAELNGRPVSASELQALALTNCGHFTTLRVEEGRVRGLRLHLDRLVRDCRTVLDSELDPAYVRRLLRRALPAGASRTVRVTVFDPALSVAAPGGDARPAVLVTTRPAPTEPPPPLRVRSVCYERDLPQVKSVGLFGALWHGRAARRTGFDDALLVDRRGRVCEGPTWNVGFVRGEEVVWPEADCLPGTTRQLLQQAYPYATTRPVPLAGLGSFDAVFASNAVVGVRVVSGVDDHRFPESHPVVDRLRQSLGRLPAERV